jgi:hypothetical protein
MLTYAKLPGPPEHKPLNFAYILECAQATFYADLLLRLTSGGNSTANLHIPGLELAPQSPDVVFANTIRQVETDHRDLISTTLATNAITPPAFNFRLETQSRQQALAFALKLEQTTARAYLGLLSRLPTATHATLLTSMQGTESRHVAILTMLTNSLFNLSSPPISPTSTGREPALHPDAALRLLSPYLLL